MWNVIEKPVGIPTSLNVIKSQSGSDDVRVNPFIELGVGVGRKVVLPVADLTLADELHLLIHFLVDLLLHQWILEHNRLEIDAGILLHLLKLYVVADLIDVVGGELSADVEMVGALLDDGGQVALHVLVFHHKYIRLMLSLVKLQHVLTRRSVNHFVIQKHVDELVERAIHLMDQKAIMVERHRLVLRVAHCVHDFGVRRACQLLGQQMPR